MSRIDSAGRIADSAIYLHAIACVLSRLNDQLHKGESGVRFERDRLAALHFIDMAEHEIRQRFHALFDNDDDSMRAAAKAQLAYSDTLPNAEFYIPEWSPSAKGTGKKHKQDGIKQFPGDRHASPDGNGQPQQFAHEPGERTLEHAK